MNPRDFVAHPVPVNDGVAAGHQKVFFAGHKPVVSWRLLEDGLILC